jgi:hypothetical protein
LVALQESKTSPRHPSFAADMAWFKLPNRCAIAPPANRADEVWPKGVKSALQLLGVVFAFAEVNV